MGHSHSTSGKGKGKGKDRDKKHKKTGPPLRVPVLDTTCPMCRNNALFVSTYHL